MKQICPEDEHEWGDWEEIRDQNYHILFASMRPCKKCPAQEWEEYWSARCGGSRKIFIPKEPQ